SPLAKCDLLTKIQINRLWHAIRIVLATAIEKGSTVPLDFAGTRRVDNLFYYGTNDTQSYYDEGLRVYDREGQPCRPCSRPIKKPVQAATSTYFCSNCQKMRIRRVSV